MPNHHGTEHLLASVHAALQQIGYRGGLLRPGYRFADILAPEETELHVALAAFAEEPPDYRNACIGVVVLEHNTPETVQPFLALGAPHILALSPTTREARQWRMEAQGQPQLIEQIESARLPELIVEREHEWGPDQVLRAKSIRFQAGPVQRDIFDVGLIPALEEIVHNKLDSLLHNAIASCEKAYREHHEDAPNYAALFHLIFRFLTAKVLADRQFPGSASWTTSDAETVLVAVERIYLHRPSPSLMIDDREVQRVAWNVIRQSFNMQNISVQALAYVFENTLVSTETRRQYNTHATPHEIAEYVVAHLPIERLPLNERSVFEPFAGHAPFLIAAMGKLRSLLPAETTASQRHAYLVQMLSGMEGDPFAFEDAYISLMLADYPNPNGWNIQFGDVFASSHFDRYLAEARIVLCNPPFGEFSRADRSANPSIVSPLKAVEALRRVLLRPPKMLGFVLPRGVIDGRSFHDLNREIDDVYNDVSLVELPDKTFQYSEAETVLLIAHGERTSQPRRSSAIVKGEDLQHFLRTGQVSAGHTWQPHTPDLDDDLILWRTPLLRRVWQAFVARPRLGQVAQIHRGVEYTGNIATFVSQTPKAGYVRGLATVDQALEPYYIRSSVYLSRNPEDMRWKAFTYRWDLPKVIAPAARLGRGPWRIIGAIDHSGLMCSQRFHGIWPTGDLPVEVLAALLNGPVANAFLSTRTSGRDNTIDLITKIPIPAFSVAQVQSVVSLVHEYQGYRKQWHEQPDRADFFVGLCRDVLWQIDAEVLAAYALQPEAEHELLAYFSHTNRPGPVRFTQYLPDDLASPVSLQEYTRAETARVLADLDQLADEIGESLPDDVSAVDVVREVRREL